MAQFIIKNLDDLVMDRLRLRAKCHGVSLEEEVRNILIAAAHEAIGHPRKPIWKPRPHNRKALIAQNVMRRTRTARSHRDFTIGK